MFFQARHFDTLAIVGDTYRDDITIEGRCLREECAELYCGSGAELDAERALEGHCTEIVR
ncbi:hypothetical protein [Sphingomonas glacialis]|uniref:Uncharacterized protein n=1 Tax=Sphingomonas glacialis TaxID=658225 RepID=A0A502FRH3_9SPHN|nr:hypothetical protein [Sphingomonas glacialis]TPG52011.1 hypothetical protein EAH76_14900 [Sphingomonas glacialis]